MLSSRDSNMYQLSAESPVDRLNRSRANQHQIEQTVLEYEKTIQNLESNLSNTRSQLAHAQSSLLEKDAKCVRAETVNQQLNSRMQKLVYRESNNKTYLRDLEARLEGQTSGKEKDGAIIIELKKEIARARECEANAEDYISTLEERLAEADQDMEMMQREVDQLEHVVDRQRSLGKLDHLLQDLDHKPPNGNITTGAGPFQNITRTSRREQALQQAKSRDDLRQARETPLPDIDDQELLEQLSSDKDDVDLPEDDDLDILVRCAPDLKHGRAAKPSQADMMAQKLEETMSELVALRLEHENTTSQFRLLSAKHEEALQGLAKAHDTGKKSPSAINTKSARPVSGSQPSSTLEEFESVGSENDVPLSPSRPISSARSSAEQNPSMMPDGHAQTTGHDKVKDASPDIENLRRMLAEHEHGMSLVTQQYAQLQAEHQQTLETMDILRAETRKLKFSASQSPSQLSPVIRRATSQNTILTDRANKSLASLRTLLTEEFESRPSRMETAEAYLTAASHELQARLERIQFLETEMKNVKKEMDAKMTIISGLTRERNSLKGSSPVDLSMVSQIRDQLIQNENEIRTLHQNHASREEELLAEISALKQEQATLSQPNAGGEQNGKIPSFANDITERGTSAQNQREPSPVPDRSLSSSHNSPESAMSGSLPPRSVTRSGSNSSAERGLALRDTSPTGRISHDVVGGLRGELAQHKASVAGLEQGNKAMRELIAQHQQEFDEKDRRIAAQNEELEQMTQEIADHKSTLASQKDRLNSLHESYNSKIEEMKLSHAGQLAELDDQHAELQQANQRAIKSLETQMESSDRNLHSLLARAGSVLGRETSADMLHVHIQDFLNDKSVMSQSHANAMQPDADSQRQQGGWQDSESDSVGGTPSPSEHQAKLQSLTEEIAALGDTIRSKEQKIKKQDAVIDSINIEKKNSARIIEELEQQIETSFDHHHNRLSVVQQQGNQALVDAQARITSLEKELGALGRGSEADSSAPAQHSQSPRADNQNRHSSMSVNLRKSASVASLPSPPPAIPLPPLPALATLSPNANVNGLAPSNASASPPASRHGSKELPALSSHHAQLIEDQEARIRTIEKHLNAEKQLTATLEEALVDLETQSNKLRSEMDSWKKKAWSAEEELQGLRRDKKHARESIQAVEMERDKRREAEAERARLEERMNQLSRKKKKNALNCF